jgi:hypothetical protein
MPRILLNTNADDGYDDAWRSITPAYVAPEVAEAHNRWLEWQPFNRGTPKRVIRADQYQPVPKRPWWVSVHVSLRYWRARCTPRWIGRPKLFRETRELLASCRWYKQSGFGPPFPPLPWYLKPFA